MLAAGGVPLFNGSAPSNQICKPETCGGLTVDDVDVEPLELIAVIPTAYPVPALSPVKVAVLLATDNDNGAVVTPFNVNVYDVAPFPPDQLKESELAVETLVTFIIFDGNVGMLTGSEAVEPAPFTAVIIIA